MTENFLQKVNELRDIFLKNENKSFLSSSNSLSTLASDFSTVLNFDTSLLVDFHEKLLMQYPVPVKKISPLGKFTPVHFTPYTLYKKMGYLTMI